MLTLTPYWKTRLFRHLWLAIFAFIVFSAFYTALPSPDLRHRISLASAYVAVIYLAVCLGIGPYLLWRKRPIPVSFDLRRDIGIWAGLLASVHTAVGLTVHLRGRMWMYFFQALHPLAVQKSWFGLANYAGAVVELVFVLLLVTSNNLSLRKLGTMRWKSIQRWSYIAAGFTAVHGFLYQLVEKRGVSWVAFLAVVLLLALALQLCGVLLHRARQRQVRPRSSSGRQSPNSGQTDSRIADW